jgi:putative FmdB family regulatory protein
VPLYDYDCANCGRRFELMHGVHADEPTTCPLCGGGPIRKAINAPAVHFKGSGWAKKERHSSAASRSAKAAGDTGPSSDSGSSGDGGSTGGGASDDSGSSPEGVDKKDRGSSPSTTTASDTATVTPKAD